MKNELKLIADVYDRIILKIDNFGGLKKNDFDELVKKESTSIFVYCKDAVHPDFYSKKFEPIANAKSNITKKSSLHHSYYLRIGYTHNFDNSLKQKEKTLFFSKDLNNLNFTDHLSNFYHKLFEGASIEAIKSTILLEKSFHIVLIFRNANTIKTNSDTIIAAATYTLGTEFCLLMWIGVNRQLAFTSGFGNKVISKGPVKHFQRHFHIGKFIMHSVQKIIAIKKGKNFPICCQCHDELEDGPRMFYENLCMFQLIGEYSIPIRLKIEKSFPKNLIYPTDENTRLIWMVGYAHFSVVTNDWVSNNDLADFLKKKNNLTDLFVYVAYKQFFLLDSRLFYYDNAADRKQKSINEVKATHDITKYISEYNDLIGKEKWMNVDKMFVISKFIMDGLSRKKKITPIVDDQVFNELLMDKNNKISKLIISDNGQGILPYEGNCGFLAMSQFLVGHPHEYYCLRIFFHICLNLYHYYRTITL